MHTEKDIKAMLDKEAIPTGTWGQTRQVEVSPFTPSQREILMKLRAILQTQIQQDRETLDRLHVENQKRRHGGGG